MVVVKASNGSDSSAALPAQAGKPLWQLLLDSALEQGLDALLDCGALLAGVGNR
jgi:hypothetical protein